MKFKDVAHLYFGCKGYLPNDDGIGGVNGDTATLQYNTLAGTFYGIEMFTPILYPISSMTEEQDREFFGTVMNLNKQFKLEYGFKIKKESGFISIWDNDTDKWYVIIKPSGNGLPCFNCTYSMAETSWLLKNGVDLFGLIESGEAIDGSKHTHTAHCL